jgi:hypothetical protein
LCHNVIVALDGLFHLNLGNIKDAEVEFSNNFIYNTYDDKSFFVNPTLAVKWNF